MRGSRYPGAHYRAAHRPGRRDDRVYGRRAGDRGRHDRLRHRPDRSHDTARPQRLRAAERVRIRPGARDVRHQLHRGGGRHRSREGGGERWLDGYYQCAEVLRQFRDTFSSYRDGKEIRRWLRGWIDKHPLTGFCFLADELATMSAEALADESALARILFYLVQDCRNSYLTCARFACGAGAGVPLARGLAPAFLERQRRMLGARDRCLPAVPAAAAPAVLARAARDGQRRPGHLAPVGGRLRGTRGTWRETQSPEEFTLPPTLAGWPTS